MKVSTAVVSYIKQVSTISNNEIIITDLNKIIHTCIKDNTLNLINQPISNDILELCNMWKNQQKFNDNFLMLNNNFKKIFIDDSIKYSAQMFFPIYHNNSIDGFIIFFRQFGNYIQTSSKAPSTARNFVEKLSDDNYIEKENV